MRILHVMGGNEEGGLEKHVIERSTHWPNIRTIR